MKHTKHALAVLLALVLALTLALPAFAADDPNPAMPVITVQPQSVRVKADRDFTLSMKAHIPNGDEISYRWWWDDGYSLHLLGGTEKITLNRNPDTCYIYVEVFNAVHPEYSVTSETVCVEVYRPRFEENLINSLFVVMLFAPLIGYPYGVLVNVLLFVLRLF